MSDLITFIAIISLWLLSVVSAYLVGYSLGQQRMFREYKERFEESIRRADETWRGNN